LLTSCGFIEEFQRHQNFAWPVEFGAHMVCDTSVSRKAPFSRVDMQILPVLRSTMLWGVVRRVVLHSDEMTRTKRPHAARESWKGSRSKTGKRKQRRSDDTIGQLDPHIRRCLMTCLIASGDTRLSNTLILGEYTRTEPRSLAVTLNCSQAVSQQYPGSTRWAAASRGSKLLYNQGNHHQELSHVT
jgi:hypothetical protein